MPGLRTQRARLDGVVAAAGSFYHLVNILTVVKGQRRHELLKTWLLQQAPGSKLAELDRDSEEHKFFQENKTGEHIANA